MISRRESLHTHKTRMLKPPRQNKVTNEIVAAHLYGNEGHSHLKGDARLLRQHFHLPTFSNHLCERIKQFTNVLALSRKVRLQADVAARMTLIAIRETASAFRAAPKRWQLFRRARHHQSV